MNQYGFGTVLGYHSVAELSDLVFAKDVALLNLAARVQQIQDLPIDLSTFNAAYANLVNRYSVARTAALKAIDDASNSFRPANMIIADSEYNNLLSALNPRWQENTWNPGDGSLEDLYNQVEQFGATGQTDVPTPQPEQGSDVDFNALQTSNAAINAIGDPLGQASSLFDTKHLIVYGIVGGAFALFVLPRLMAMSMGPMLLRR
jgi:hypothetical protein